MADCMCWNNGDVRWDILLIGSCKSFDLFFDLPRSINIKRNREDCIF